MNVKTTANPMPSGTRSGAGPTGVREIGERDRDGELDKVYTRRWVRHKKLIRGLLIGQKTDLWERPDGFGVPGDRQNAKGLRNVLDAVPQKARLEVKA